MDTEGLDLKNKVKNILIFLPFALLSIGLFFGEGYIFANENHTSINIRKDIFGAEIDTPRSIAPRNVFVVTRDCTKTFLVYSLFAKDILKEVSVYVDQNDEILPSKTFLVPQNGRIVLVKVNSEVFEKMEAIEFKTKRIADDDMNKGKERIEVIGSNGLSKITYRVIYKDGKAVRSETMKVETVIPAVTQVMYYGTKPVTIQSCEYWDEAIDREVPRTKDIRKNTWMRFVMRCETWCNSGKVTNSSKTGLPLYFGLYQFSQRTFEGKGGKNIFDGYEQIEIVKSMYEGGEDYRNLQWPNCNVRFNRDFPQF